MRRMSEAVDDGPLLTVQNPAEVIGETVIDCRPAVLPVSIPLCALSPATVAEAGVIPLTEAADFLDRGDGFDLDLRGAAVVGGGGACCTCDPAVATVIESPGYSVPEDLTLTWVPEYAPVPEVAAVDAGGQTRSPEHSPPNTVPASAVAPVVNPVTLEQFVPPIPSPLRM